jgi:DNA repair exonuclease SbcCD nuclease subunit
MKFILSADTHYRKKAPRSRTDNYFQSQVVKTEWLLKQCKNEKAALLLAGDIFDSSTPSFEVVSTYLNLFKNSTTDIFTIFGNHDLQNHRMSNSANTGLGLLVAAGAVTPLSSTPINYKGTDLYGANWDEPIPQIAEKNKYNVCLIHDMIIQEEEIIPYKQEQAIEGNYLIKKYDFDLMISGHNHQSFVCKDGSKILCNPGSISRLTSAQIDHRPRIGCIDTDIGIYSWIDIPVSPSSEVFDLDNIQTSKETKLDMENFVTALKANVLVKPNFSTAINIHIKNNNFDDAVVDLLHAALKD